MRQERLGGWALIAGTLMGLVTMILHPTAGDVARDPQGQGALGVAVHGLALAGVPISFYGALVLARRLARGSALAELALVFYGASSVAAIVAAVASGFLATDLLVGMSELQGEARTVAGALLRYTGSVNQAFAQVLVAASSAAIGLWSAVILRSRLLRRAAGILGCAVSVPTLAALLSGRLTLDVHGFGAVVLGQSAWLVLVGLELRRLPPLDDKR